MKKRIVSIALLVVLLLSLALTVSAECEHTYEFDHDEKGPYYYYDDTYCARDCIEYRKCTICGEITGVPPVSLLYYHSFGDPVYVGTLSSGEEWWYHDCVNCGTRIDFYE